MSPHHKLIFRILALWALGAAAFHQLTAWAAPAEEEAALLIGFLLPAFGVGVGIFARNLVVLPFAVLRMGLRAARGQKAIVVNARGPDPLDWLGRAAFVVGFATLCGVIGACVGFVDGGAGVFATAAAFAAAGAVLAVLMPADVVFADDVNTGGSVTDAQRADFEAARAAGEPTMLATDRLVKDLREKFVEDQGKR